MKFILIVVGGLSIYGMAYLLQKHASHLSYQEAFHLGQVTVSWTSAILIAFLMLVIGVIYKVKG